METGGWLTRGKDSAEMPALTGRRRPRTDPGAFNCSGGYLERMPSYAPSDATSATRGGVSRLRVGDIIFTSRDGGGGRIGGDVVSYVEYAIAVLFEDAEKKFVVLATGFWASLTLYIHASVSDLLYPRPDRLFC